MLEIFGFISAVLMGVVLGILGGGGSILTIPVLVYFLNIPPLNATAYSLFIVGLASLIGSTRYMKKEQVSYKSAIFFATPSLITILITRRILLPVIPDNIFSVNEFILTKNLAVLIFFAIVMVIASLSMIKQRKLENKIRQKEESNIILLVLEGIIVGFITGLIGAGGGFLIVPALVIFARLPMKKAIGTSLLVIAINSLLGFTGDALASSFINWSFLIEFSVLAVAGILLGSYFSGFISGQKLKPVFGWFILFMGTFIIVKEVIFNLHI